MAGRIQSEIRQTKPIGSLEEEAFLNVQRTANELAQAMGELLKEHDLTQTQYNVLRILRGAGKAGLTAGDIGERMITRDPDVTRLLDRLERRGLVERWRCTEDRRVVWTRITAQGGDAITPLDASVDALHVRLLAHMGEDRLRQLVELLETARDGMSA
jgi:DNA-binding MarR family transcriptional regulator